MNDFYLGFAFGSVIIGLVTTPFLTYFGIVFFNLRRMEKSLQKDAEKPSPKIIIDDDVAKTVKEAEELLKKKEA